MLIVPVCSSAFNKYQSPLTMNEAIDKLYPDTVHNMALLSQYKIFKGNEIIKHAFIISPNHIEITLQENYKPQSLSVNIKSYDYNLQLKESSFATLPAYSPTCTMIKNVITIKDVNLDLTKNYMVEVDNRKVNLYLSPAIGGVLDTYFDNSDTSDMGVTYSGNNAVFKLWSPPAGRVELVIFDKNENVIPCKNPLLMSNMGKGIWEINVKPTDLIGVSSLDGLFYQYKVYAYGEVRMALDPYAKSMASFDPASEDKIGKGAIVNMNDIKAKPAVFNKSYSNAKYMANEADMVAYEVHVRDFTIQPDIFEPDIAGTYKGFIQKTDYLKNLGITHVQLMPVNNFYTVNENDREYKKGNARESNYNWGYDPHNYFTVEGWLTTDSKNPYTRIKEYRELVQALHNKGIGVIMDVVYNHCYMAETFENVAPGCYLRLDSNFAISGRTGAGPSFESRHKMARKLIIESLNHFVKEYNIDGFRFDLMGFLDHETMLAIKEEVGKTYNPANTGELILQGEAWIFSDLDIDEKARGINAATTKINYPKSKFDIAFFNDSSRDSYTGRESNKGFVQGVYKEVDRVATGIIGGIVNYNAGEKAINTDVFNDSYNRFAETPANCLNYLSIHDGFTLWDKLNLSIKDYSKAERARIMRLASAMLFTSQGKIILNGGDEMLRTKPLSSIDKESNRAITTEFTDEEEGTLYFHGNTYCSNDYTNMFRWDRLNNEYYEFSSLMIDYYKGLINMRRQIPCLRYNEAESIRKGLVFLGADSQGNAEKPNFSGFNDEKLERFEIEFINGSPYERYYIAGEIYPKNTPPNFENPEMYFVDFDGNGKATIVFDKAQIQNFDLNKWGEAGHLNIKLIKTPGQWNYLPNAYTDLGNNVIKINGLAKSGKANIDLSKKDFVAVDIPRVYDTYIAYWLDNTLEKDLAKGLTGTTYTQLIVVHNADEESVTVNTEHIKNQAEWVVICDSYNAGIKPLKFSAVPTTKKGETNVLIEEGKLNVPRKSTVVIAKIK